MVRTGGRLLRRTAMLGVCALLCCSGASALTDEEVFREFPFNFMNAGPRAMGLAGAFVGIADDVTAGQANPAGLTALDEPQFFAELRSLDQDAGVSGGRTGSLDVDPVNGSRELPFLGVTSVSEPDSVVAPTFVGAAWPFRLGSSGRRLTVTASRQVLLDDQRSLGSGDQRTEASFAFESFPNTVSGGVVQAYSVNTVVDGSADTEIVYWNVGAALQVHPDFSFGYTLTYATLDLSSDTLTTVTDPAELFVDPSHPRLPMQPARDLYRTRADGTDDDLSYTVGVHWRPDSVFAGGDSPWELGAVFRKGASFGVTERTELNGVADESFVNRITVPDRFSVGVGYEFTSAWRISVDVERIEYSDMMAGFRSGVNYLTSGRVADGAFGVNAGSSIVYDVSDVTVPRLGVEHGFSLTGGTSDAVIRFGAYHMPDHRIRMTRFNSSDPDVNRAYLDAFGGGDDRTHLTAGFGYDFGPSTLALAADVADDGVQVVLGYTYRMLRRARP